VIVVEFTTNHTSRTYHH